MFLPSHFRRKYRITVGGAAQEFGHGGTVAGGDAEGSAKTRIHRTEGFQILQLHGTRYQLAVARVQSHALAGGPLLPHFLHVRHDFVIGARTRQRVFEAVATTVVYPFQLTEHVDDAAHAQIWGAVEVGETETLAALQTFEPFGALKGQQGAAVEFQTAGARPLG